MAKRCQEEYEDVSEVLHPSTLSTLYMYIPWPRLNVCLTCTKLSLYTSLLRQSVRLSLLRQCLFSLYRSLLCISHAQYVHEHVAIGTTETAAMQPPPAPRN